MAKLTDNLGCRYMHKLSPFYTKKQENMWAANCLHCKNPLIKLILIECSKTGDIGG